jgi:hypothetical protein
MVYTQTTDNGPVTHRHPDTFKPARCPQCDAESVSVTGSTNRMNVTTQYLICGNEHLWMQSWTVTT